MRKKSQTIWIGDVEYCVYCAEPMKEEIELDDYHSSLYEYCDCVGARQDVEIQKKIELLENEFPRRYEAKLTQIAYEHDLAEINKKYGKTK